MDRRSFIRAAASVPLVGTVASCGSEELLGQQDALRIAVTWSGLELAAFRGVLDRVWSDTPVELISYGDQIDTVLDLRGPLRPDLLLLPQPGLLRDHLHELEPLDRLWPPESGDYADVWRKLLSGSGTSVYGVPFKAAHKSMVWYDRRLFGARGFEVPTTWNAWIALIDRIRADPRGTAPLALGAADGWVLTDFFENVLLSQERLAYTLLENWGGGTAWDRPGVASTLAALGDLWRRPHVFSGGVGRVLWQQFPDAVREVFEHHSAAMVVAPDFADAVVRQIYPDARDRDRSVGVFRFPALSVGGSPPLVAGGDFIALPKPARQQAWDLAESLVRPNAPNSWIRDHGGFLSAHRRTRVVSRSGEDHYAAEFRAVATSLAREPDVRFDLSDQLGAVGGQHGLQQVLTELLVRVNDGTSPRSAATAAVRELKRFEKRWGG